MLKPIPMKTKSTKFHVTFLTVTLSSHRINSLETAKKSNCVIVYKNIYMCHQIKGKNNLRKNNTVIEINCL